MTSQLTPIIAHRTWDFIQVLQAMEFVHRVYKLIANAIGTAFNNFCFSLIAPVIEGLENTIKVVTVGGVVLCVGGILALYLRAARPATQ
jgi:hypothetical protein